MPPKVRAHAVLTAVLAALLFLFFSAAKQDPSNPFTEDPYDAVGSFAVQAAPALALYSVWRAFRPAREPQGEPEIVLTARTQLLAVLAVLITLAADVVAVARDPSWSATARAPAVAAAILSLGSFGLLLAIFILRTVAKSGVPRGRDIWLRPALISVGAALLLAGYPARWLSSIAGTLLAVVVGALALFAPMGNLSMALLPPHPQPDVDGAVARSTAIPWRVILPIGALVGLLLALAESREGGGVPELARVGLVVSVFVGLEVTGLLMAFLFLREPLGLRPRGNPTGTREPPE